MSSDWGIKVTPGEALPCDVTVTPPREARSGHPRYKRVPVQVSACLPTSGLGTFLLTRALKMNQGLNKTGERDKKKNDFIF